MDPLPREQTDKTENITFSRTTYVISINSLPNLEIAESGCGGGGMKVARS